MSKFGIAFGYIVTALSDEAISINAKVVAGVDNADLCAALVKQANASADLLEALEQVARVGDNDPDCNLCGEYVTARHIARAAIAKAEGA